MDREYLDRNVINLVTNYPASLKDWTIEDIERGAAHVWQCIRPKTREELSLDVQTIFGTGDMTKHVTAIMMTASENSLTLTSNETGERLQIPHLFADGKIVTFDLRMKSEAEVIRAFLRAQKQ